MPTVHGEQYAQVDNADPFAPAIWRSPVHRTPEWIIWLVQLAPPAGPGRVVRRAPPAAGCGRWGAGAGLVSGRVAGCHRRRHQCRWGAGDCADHVAGLVHPAWSRSRPGAGGAGGGATGAAGGRC